MNILDLLKKDHEKVAKILENLAGTSITAMKTREKLFGDLSTSFLMHAQFEEDCFYPLIEEKNDNKNIILEAYEEHQAVKVLLKELSLVSYYADEWLAKLTAIKENIEHHVKEEENELFQKVKKILNTEELNQLGAKFKQFHSEK